MLTTDWAYLNDSLDTAMVERGAPAGFVTPPGGGDFLFAFNSLTAATGAVGIYCGLPDFAPMAKGSSIRGCIQRGPGGGPKGFCPFFFLGGQGNSVHDNAYLLGLSDDDPYRIVLRKGMVAAGIPDADGVNVLRASGEAFSIGTWLHLRLDAITNDNGDVVLNVYRNDLEAHALNTPPDWQPIPGMGMYIDDHVGIHSGSQPLTSGYGGFGFAASDVTRRGYFDHIEILRQT